VHQHFFLCMKQLVYQRSANAKNRFCHKGKSKQTYSAHCSPANGAATTLLSTYRLSYFTEGS
jgi:hypothetical protein